MVQALSPGRKQFEALKQTRAFRIWLNEQRDIQDGLCFYCRRPLYIDEEVPHRYPDEWYEVGGPCFGLPRTFTNRTWIYHVEHVVPLKRGGQNSFVNLVLSCAPCNLAKSTMLVT